MREFIKIKSVQSGNPFKSVIQTVYDTVKAHSLVHFFVFGFILSSVVDFGAR